METTKKSSIFCRVSLSTIVLWSFIACHPNEVKVSSYAPEANVLAAMTEAIQDEYRAEAFYQKTLSKFGPVMPFANIVNAEVKHQQALATLFKGYNLPIPASQWKDSDIPTFSNVQASCAACYQAEIDNIALYDKYLLLNLPTEVRRVFENNRAASLNNHMPAFERCK